MPFTFIPAFSVREAVARQGWAARNAEGTLSGLTIVQAVSLPGGPFQCMTLLLVCITLHREHARKEAMAMYDAQHGNDDMAQQ